MRAIPLFGCRTLRGFQGAGLADTRRKNKDNAEALKTQIVARALQRVPIWEARVHPPVFFQRVRKLFAMNGLQIFHFWECAGRLK